MTSDVNDRQRQLATALAPHQQKFDDLDALYVRRMELRGLLYEIDELIRRLTVELYDGMTVQVIQAEIGK